MIQLVKETNQLGCRRQKDKMSTSGLKLEKFLPLIMQFSICFCILVDDLKWNYFPVIWVSSYFTGNKGNTEIKN